MSIADIRVQRTTKEVHSYKIDDQQLIELFRRCGFDIPVTANVSVRVPGGGDWSNTDLGIRLDCPIEITWTVLREDNC